MTYLKCLAIASASVFAVLLLMFALGLFFAAFADQNLGAFLASICLLILWFSAAIYICQG